MKFSTRSEYGLRAIASLARHHQERPYSLAKIAKDENISQAYLERLFSRLKKSKLIKSAKGVKGGYQLTQSPDKIKISAVFEALEGSLSPYSCADKKSHCAQKPNCCVHSVWQNLYKNMVAFLDSVSLADLIKNNK